MDIKIGSEERPFEKDMMFSKVIKAGSRIYYIDVKKSKKEDMYITITESKEFHKETKRLPDTKSINYSYIKRTLKSSKMP